MKLEYTNLGPLIPIITGKGTNRDALLIAGKADHLFDLAVNAGDRSVLNEKTRN